MSAQELIRWPLIGEATANVNIYVEYRHPGCIKAVGHNKPGRENESFAIVKIDAGGRISSLRNCDFCGQTDAMSVNLLSIKAA